jgi:hypothetical protein
MIVQFDVLKQSGADRLASEQIRFGDAAVPLPGGQFSLTGRAC